MDGQSLSNILALLRVIRNTSPSSSVSQFIAGLAKQDVSPQSTLNIAAYLIEQIQQAQLVINSSKLSDEAKGGVLSVLQMMTDVFSLGNMAGQMVGLVQAAPAAIANFVILLGAYNIPENNEIPDEAVDLIKEIEDILPLFNESNIDPSVRDVAQRHLRILASLLKNINLIGLEPALAEYFIVVTKIRRTDIGASEESHKAVKPIWDRIKTWGDRLGALDKIWNAGAKLLEQTDKAKGLLDYFPDIDV